MKSNKLTKGLAVVVLVCAASSSLQAFSLTKEKTKDPLQSKIDMLEQQVSELSEKIHRFEAYFNKSSQATDLLQSARVQTPKISTVRDEIEAMSQQLHSTTKKAPTQQAHEVQEKVDTEAGLYQKIIALIVKRGAR